MPEAPEDSPFSELIGRSEGMSAALTAMFPASQAAMAIYISQLVENILEGSLTSNPT